MSVDSEEARQAETLRRRIAEAATLHTVGFDDLEPISAIRVLTLAREAVADARRCLRCGMNPDASLRGAEVLLEAVLSSGFCGRVVGR